MSEVMRGEITHVFMFQSEHSEEDILNSFYVCDNSAQNLKNPILNWSNMLMTKHWREFKRKASGFCIGKVFSKRLPSIILS